MPNFLKRLDGSGRTPFSTQLTALEWLEKEWDAADVFCISAPVGTGKSLISKAIQLATQAHVITPSNLLVNQYAADYPDTNVMQGKQHYSCTWSGLSCGDWQDSLSQKACESCPYTAAKQKACSGEPTFFNPVSLYYTTKAQGWTPPEVIVVDEAHQLSSMISLLCGARLRKSMYGFDERVCNELFAIEWLKTQERRLKRLSDLYGKQQDFKRLMEIAKETSSVRMTREGLEQDAQNYAIWLETGTYRNKPETFLNIKPIQPPRFVVDRLLKAKKIILMSGTIMPSDIEDLLGERPYKFLDLPSPIPVESRPVYYRPAPFKMNFETNPAKVVEEIEKVIRENPGLNTIIHVSYSWSKKLRHYFTIPIIVNDEKDKDAKVAEFKEKGGVFLAAGCAEGLDLKGDLCRLNVIPKLLYPDLNDPVVKKRMSLSDGKQWYNSETLKKLVQQTGRSTRGIQDYSKTYVLDSQFGWRVKEYGKHLPRSFIESIQWARESAAPTALTDKLKRVSNGT